MGNFYTPSPSAFMHSCMHQCSCARLSAFSCLCCNFILLFTAGIELNPGSMTCAELTVLITNLTVLLNIRFQQTNNKLDAFVTEMVDLKVKLTTLDLSHNIENIALKISLAQVTKELYDIEASNTSFSAHWPTLLPSTTTPGSHLTINNLAV